MKKKLIMQLLKMAMQEEEKEVNNEVNNEINNEVNNEEIRIAVLQRGWVCIGRYSEHGDKCRLDDAYVIRRWGTDKGLGQLANEGKQEKTEMEKTGVVEWHKMTGILTIKCKKEKWKNKL